MKFGSGFMPTTTLLLTFALCTFASERTLADRYDDDPDGEDVVSNPNPISICNVINDLFGATAESSAALDFDYDVTMLEGEDADKLDEVLGTLESEVVNQLLPSLFDGQCGRAGSGGRRLQGGVTGMSSQPRDVVVNGVGCESGNDNCFAVDGGATIYGDTSDVDFDELLNGLKAKMEAGDLDDIDGVKSVRLRSEKIVTPVETAPTSAPGPLSASSEDNGFPIWAYIVIALGGALCIFVTIAVILCARRQNGEEEEEEEAEPEAGKVVDEETLAPTVAANTNVDD